MPQDNPNYDPSRGGYYGGRRAVIDLKERNALAALNAANGINPATFASDQLKDIIGGVRAERQGLVGSRDRLQTMVGTAREREGRGLRGAISSSLAQRFAPKQTGFSGALDDAVGRAKVRQQISQRGDKAIANQQLRDRIGLAKMSRTRRGQLQSALGRGAQIRQGVNVASEAAQDLISQSRGDLYGGVAGLTTRLLQDPIKNWWQGRKMDASKIGSSTQGNLPRAGEVLG